VKSLCCVKGVESKKKKIQNILKCTYIKPVSIENHNIVCEKVPAVNFWTTIKLKLNRLLLLLFF